MAVTDDSLWRDLAKLQGRQFNTGADRDTDTNKYDYEGFLSPLVLKEFGRYMHDNRKRKDGTLRSSDNWQKGIPQDAYMKSGFRHFMDWWTIHRGTGATDFDGNNVELMDALCGLLFNVQGYMHEALKRRPEYDFYIDKCPNCSSTQLGPHTCPTFDSRFTSGLHNEE